MKNSATIQKILEVRRHPNADSLDLVKVLGWQVVTRRGEFVPGDFCVYVVADSILPDKPEFEFLRNKQFRVKPIRLRGEYSTGIIFSLKSLEPHGYNFQFSLVEGLDVSEIIGVTHYEKQMPSCLSGIAKGNFPSCLSITDELNLRSYPGAISEMLGRPYYITRKDDGSSATFLLKGDAFEVCSRRLNLKEDSTNIFWKIARKYDVEKALRLVFSNKDVAIQGEVVGPNIQNNRLGLNELELHIFNFFDIAGRGYLGFNHLKAFSAIYQIPTVEVVEKGDSFSYNIEQLIELTNSQKYPTLGPAEGIVIRPTDPFFSFTLNKYWSGKILNELYKD